MNVVSYACLYAHFGKNAQKSLTRTVFTQIEILCMERVKPGRLIDKQQMLMILVLL